MNSPMATSRERSLVHRGTGPVATVYATVPPAGGRACAVKVFPGPLDRPTATEFLDEQRTLAGLRGVSSILLADGIDELPDGRAAIRTELCAQSLTELVEVGGTPPVPDTLALAETLARVLVDAHDAGIVHGGVTPANVLFRLTGQPVLADFGLGLRQRFPRRPEAAYIAPEVLRGAEPAESADLYGLGAVLYLALTGEPPFLARPGEPAEEVLIRALGSPPAFPRRDLPTGLVDLVNALLAKDPAERPGSAAEVLDRLRDLGDPGAQAPDETTDVPAVPAVPAVPVVAAIPEVPTDDPAPAPLPAPLPPAPAGGPPRSERRPGQRWWYAALPAAAAVLAVLAVLLAPISNGDADREGVPDAAGQPAVRSSKPPRPTPSTPTQSSASSAKSPATKSRSSAGDPGNAAVKLEIHRLRDHGTTVTLAWRSAKPLTYAVFVAEQGRTSPSVRYRGSGTTLTVPVRSAVEYCFLVQGTDGTSTFESPARGIRGAECRN